MPLGIESFLLNTYNIVQTHMNSLSMIPMMSRTRWWCCCWRWWWWWWWNIRLRCLSVCFFISWLNYMRHKLVYESVCVCRRLMHTLAVMGSLQMKFMKFTEISKRCNAVAKTNIMHRLVRGICGLCLRAIDLRLTIARCVHSTFLIWRMKRDRGNQHTCVYIYIYIYPCQARRERWLDTRFSHAFDLLNLLFYTIIYSHVNMQLYQMPQVQCTGPTKCAHVSG